MKYVVNVQSKEPDEDPRSLRARVKDRDRSVLRDTYWLVDPETGPSKNLKMGYTVIYPPGTTTRHTHDDEEVNFVISGEGLCRLEKEVTKLSQVTLYMFRWSV